MGKAIGSFKRKGNRNIRMCGIKVLPFNFTISSAYGRKIQP